MGSKQRILPHTIKEPVRIRRNIQAFGDPYIDEEQLHENSVCRSCGDIYTAGRWYNPEQVGKKGEHGAAAALASVVCPACRKMRDRVPSGVLRLTGTFLTNHREEILNLIRNETRKADAVNPLERIMSIHSTDGEVEITTTNEKLAQRIGRAVHKAYSGIVEYKWSGDDKLARVNWHREA